jgi:CHAT domain-containing protein
MLPEEREAALVAHAAGCGYCGPRLRDAIDDLRAEITPEEQVMIDGLRTSTGAGRKELVDQLVSMSAPRRRWTPVRWGAVAAAVAVAVAGGLWWKWYSDSRPDALMARAYSDWRTTELRIPGASYSAPVSVTRSAKGLDQPKSFLQALAVIAGHLQTNPSDPAWLHARGQALLLARDYEAARETLQRADDTAGDNAPLQTAISLDMAAVSYEQARALSRPELYADAMEALSRVIQREPNHAVALFNRAIVAEALFLFTQAEADWQRFLTLEPRGDWADEARRHLAALKSRSDQHWVDPDPDPATYLRDAAANRLRDSEDYYETAITAWLPARDRSAQALQTLATRLREEHRDPWLFDLLQSPANSAFQSGAALYAEAYRANHTGQFDLARGRALEAAAHFRSAGNLPAELGARVEWITAIGRTRQRGTVPGEAGLVERLRKRGYPWLLAQAIIAQESDYQSGNLRHGREQSEAALAIVSASRYDALALRILPFLVRTDLDVANLPPVWTHHLDGLARYWNRPQPPMRAFSLYWYLGTAAYADNKPHTALAYHREAARFAGQTPSELPKAATAIRAAVLANQNGYRAEASGLLQEARAALSHVADGPGTRSHRDWIEEEMASLELQSGQPGAARERLERMTIDDGTDLEISSRYYRSLAAIQAIAGERPAALESLRSAAAIAQAKLTSLTADAERLHWQQEAGPVYRMLVAMQLQGPEGPETAIESWERYRFFANARAVTAAPARFLSGELGALGDSRLLVYALLDRRIGIWLADRDGVEFHWAPAPAAQAEAAAERLARACGDRDSDPAAIDRYGRDLYGWLVAPVAHRLPPGGAIRIEADGAIASIPFAALRGPDNKYLGESYAIAYSPGVWQWKDAAGMFAARPSRVLAVGSPTLSAELARRFPSLPEAAAEASGIARLFPAPSLLTGADATLAAIRRKLPGTDVFHFAGHGVTYGEGGALLVAAESGAPTDSASTLDESALTPELLRSCRLAVLSACSTGSGERRGPVNPESLVRAFLRARVANVVASRWKVDSSATAKIMEEFYVRWLAGAGVAAALQGAAESVRARPEWSHPYYWAAFSAFGRG